ncbi:MAG: hypothetical protein JWP61_1821 [Friedmanniella sp.]|nr:hypothetical protein [Friedmanniella sp.]
MTVNLNAMLNTRLPAERAVAAVLRNDVAHHVVDPDERLSLDPHRGTALDDALSTIAGRERERWVLTLPQPGMLGALRGPVELNRAALEAGEAVVAASAGLALVPYRVGQAVQWRVFDAERPFTPPPPYDAERELSEAVLRAAATLSRLEVGAGRRPKAPTLDLPAAYSPRQQASADRALRLLMACDAALENDGGSISSFEADARSRELRTVRAAASQALCAAATWVGV